MPNILRNVVAFVLGMAAGMAVNMGLILLGSALIPAPSGVDVRNAASIAAAMHLYEPKHFVMPFLSHALGTLAGAAVASAIAITHRAALAYGMGALFLLGGIAASFMIPAPAWFIALDLVIAYIPMAWLGLQAGQRLRA